MDPNGDIYASDDVPEEDAERLREWGDRIEDDELRKRIEERRNDREFRERVVAILDPQEVARYPNTAADNARLVLNEAMPFGWPMNPKGTR